MYVVFRFVLLLIIIIYTHFSEKKFHFRLDLINLQNPFIMWFISVNVLDISISWIEEVFGIIFFKRTSLLGEG